MSIYDKSMWEELVRIREVLAMDSYARQLEAVDMDRFLTKDPKLVKDVANELDECRTKMRTYAFMLKGFQ